MFSIDKEWILDNMDNGIITTSQVSAEGIHRGTLTKMINEGSLVKCSRGIYMLPDEFEDAYYITQQKYKKGILSHGTALYLLGYSERVPLSLHMTFPTNYNSESIKHENITITRVIEKYYKLGQIEIKTPYGNDVIIYDLERSLCDILRGEGDDLQIIQFAMKKYASSKKKDINKLMKYAKLLRVESKVRRYMEVLL